jgi:hypothetical protein
MRVLKREVKTKLACQCRLQSTCLLARHSFLGHISTEHKECQASVYLIEAAYSFAYNIMIMRIELILLNSQNKQHHSRDRYPRKGPMPRQGVAKLLYNLLYSYPRSSDRSREWSRD